MSPQQLFAWRRAARQSLAPEPLFVPTVVEGAAIGSHAQVFITAAKSGRSPATPA
ncbi:MAG: hypothetical protein EOS25_21295 [Mesorhizobium sp.]|nr:MAG: hypothetical protein EOS59_08210 [Mesorhizobium sp.]RWE58700.1 MAG: hypothetical protein EOS24_16990 [Mesorhizobium sp.]RWF06923.1 MAG: hypothetical protein EOS69_30985 [Mesorhizobium sp.]RWF16127.1 MAG: hypothetical protein EOS25_21295 [Mesorhizobium sp.]